MLAIPAFMLLASLVMLSEGSRSMAQVLFLGAVGLAVLLCGPFLPIYTPERARVYRAVKWITMVGLVGMAFGSNVYLASSLFSACMWPMIWIEWTRVTLRRKLPVARWPKQLYL